MTDVVIKVVNYLRANARNHRQFKSFLDEIDCEYEDVVMFTAVRWLSRANCLKRFYLLLPHIKVFISGKTDFVELHDPKWIADLGFMVDITGHLSSLNIQLQGREKLCHDLHKSVSTFIQKLKLWKSNVEVGNFNHFKFLSENCESANISAVVEIFETLISNFEWRIKDINSVLPEMKLFVTPMFVDPSLAPQDFQMELIELQSDIELQGLFKHEKLLEFWKHVPRNSHQNLVKNAMKMLSIFGSTYCCEQLFSKLIRIKNKYRSRLTQTHLDQLLRSADSSIQPQYEKLVKDQQSHCSH